MFNYLLFPVLPVVGIFILTKYPHAIAPYLVACAVLLFLRFFFARPNP